MNDDQIYDLYLRLYTKVRGGMPLERTDLMTDVGRSNAPLAGREAVAAAQAVFDGRSESKAPMEKSSLLTTINTKLGTK